MKGPLKQIDLKRGKGRPIVYNFAPFLSLKINCIVINCNPTQEVYNSIKSSFSRWRKKNNVKPGFVFDVHQTHVIIWRRVGQRQD